MGMTRTEHRYEAEVTLSRSRYRLQQPCRCVEYIATSLGTFFIMYKKMAAMDPREKPVSSMSRTRERVKIHLDYESLHVKELCVPCMCVRGIVSVV